MAMCKHLVGFLSLRECGAASVALCETCRKPLCPDHKKSIQQKTLCPECGLDLSPPEKIPPDLALEHRRRTFYRDNQYRPQVSGDAQWSHDHYMAFAVTGAVGAAALSQDGEQPLSPESFQDS